MIYELHADTPLQALSVKFLRVELGLWMSGYPLGIRPSSIRS